MSELMNPEAASFLERVVRDPSIDVGKLEQIIALQERVADREAKRQFAASMNALQAEMPQIHKDAVNPHARSRYATFESIDAVLRPLYVRHGFSVRFTTHSDNDRIRVGCTVSHVGGHSETGHELESGPDTAGARGQTNKIEVQGVGSIVSYLKRYTLMAAFAVALQDDPDDDDGEASRQTRPPPNRAGNGARKPPDGLDEQNGTIWLKNLDALLHRAQSRQDVVDLRGDPRVVRVIEGNATPPLIKSRIEAMFGAAFARLDYEAEAKVEDPPGPPTDDWPDDPIRELLAEIEAMDLIALNDLATSASWRARVRDAAQVPPDEDRVAEAIVARKAALQARRDA